MRRLFLIVLLASCEVSNPMYDEVSEKDAGPDAEAIGGGGAGGSQSPGPDADPSPTVDGATTNGGSGGESHIKVTDAGSGDGPPIVDRRDASPDVTVPVDTMMPVPESLVAHLALTEASGTVAFDSSGRSNNGRLHCVGTCSNGLPMRLFRDGRRGVEIGYWQAVDVPASSSLDTVTEDFSLFVWSHRIDQVGIRSLVSRLATDNKNYALHLYFNGGRLGATVGGSQVMDPSITPAFTWTQVGVIRRAGVMTLFRNGAPVASAAASSMPAASSPLMIGVAELGTYNVSFADAILNELVLYNRALLDTEVVDLFKGGRPR